MTLKLRHDSSGYLTCEHVSVFYLLMLTSGIMGAYTYVVRGGVFCNAQTANFLMLGISLGEGNFKHALFYFIPISAYVLGAIASEILPTPIKHYGLFRWDTWLVGFEALILFIIGFIPTTVPDPVVQVAVNFIASMQYNTFLSRNGVNPRFAGKETLQVSFLWPTASPSPSTHVVRVHLSQRERPWQSGRLSGYARDSPLWERLPPARGRWRSQKGERLVRQCLRGRACFP